LQTVSECNHILMVSPRFIADIGILGYYRE
jgi:hypothetical protein